MGFGDTAVSDEDEIMGCSGVARDLVARGTDAFGGPTLGFSTLGARILV